LARSRYPAAGAVPAPHSDFHAKATAVLRRFGLRGRRFLPPAARGVVARRASTAMPAMLRPGAMRLAQIAAGAVDGLYR